MAEMSWQQFIDNCRQAQKKVTSDLQEVEMLIEQTASEVERFTQANARSVSRARQIEKTFDTVPRDDIKRTYTSLVENQRRLFTMRGQLEKLESDKKHLERLNKLYDKILEFAAQEDIESISEGEGEMEITPKSLVISVIESQEQERLRLSRQMHDGPAQALTNLVLQAEICERLFDRDPNRARVELGELKDSVVNAFQQVKGFIFDLRPMMLDDLGLNPTLKRYTEGVTESGFTGLKLNISGQERRLAPYKEVTIFRVIQALIHIGRVQSHANTIKLSTELTDIELRVTFEDDGKGFDIDEELNSSDAQHLNLPTLRDRIEMLGGKIRFESGADRGLRVMFSVPAPEGET
ncbi:MAG: hypothetical protein GVY30_13090 [Chloroflexi bacterium]|nr:hypothetical protein [Chloroflexota bacterium]